jgi:polyisoprenoid-binding protein YceI
MKKENKTMRVWTTALALLISGGLASAETTSYKLDPAHSQVTFQIRHLISKVSGNFRDFSANITADPAKPTTSSVEFTIKTASIDTGIEKRDNHLRSADFFDAEKNPEIQFKSEKIVEKAKDEYEVTGPLTMHGVTKPVTLNVKVSGPVKTPWGSETVGFEVKGKVNRKDFGITWNTALDTGGYVLGDDVDIAIDMQAAVVKPEVAKPAAAK